MTTGVIRQEPVSREIERAFSGDRRLIPVATIDWTSIHSNQVVPLQGIDFLRDINQLIIRRTVELNELMSSTPLENRYEVKVPRGETLYYSIEASTDFQRKCFGSNRAFAIRLYDPTRQEALQLTRRLACGVCCSLFCYLQEMEIWLPPGDLLGKVQQCFSFTKPIFHVVDRTGEVVYKIEGANSIFGCFLSQKHNFQIYSGDSLVHVGTIIHQWDEVQNEYNLHVEFYNVRSKEYKALLLGATFLLEYMYFESPKKPCRCCL